MATIIQSLPCFKDFMCTLEAAFADYKDSYAQEGIVSDYTYNACKEAYTEDEMKELNQYIIEKGLKLSTPMILLSLWSRFEDAHLPSISSLVNEPVREDIDKNVYTLFSPATTEAKKGSRLTFKTGYRLVAPKNILGFLSTHADMAKKAILLSPGIISNSDKEIEVTLYFLEDTVVERNSGLVHCVFVTAGTLSTDKFIPRPKKVEAKQNDNENSDIMAISMAEQEPAKALVE